MLHGVYICRPTHIIIELCYLWLFEQELFLSKVTAGHDDLDFNSRYNVLTSIFDYGFNFICSVLLIISLTLL